MSHGDIVDDLLLVEYDEFIRKDPLASGFRNLLDVSWDRNLTNSINQSMTSGHFEHEVNDSRAVVADFYYYI